MKVKVHCFAFCRYISIKISTKVLNTKRFNLRIRLLVIVPIPSPAVRLDKLVRLHSRRIFQTRDIRPLIGLFVTTKITIVRYEQLCLERNITYSAMYRKTLVTSLHVP